MRGAGRQFPPHSSRNRQLYRPFVHVRHESACLTLPRPSPPLLQGGIACAVAFIRPASGLQYRRRELIGEIFIGDAYWSSSRRGSSDAERKRVNQSTAHKPAQLINPELFAPAVRLVQSATDQGLPPRSSVLSPHLHRQLLTQHHAAAGDL